MYENYRDNYNQLVGSLAECVQHDAMSPQKAKKFLRNAGNSEQTRFAGKGEVRQG